MGTVVRIFVRDLKRVLRNPAAVLVTIGVCIIPSLYAWINIRANWNPYENTSTVPVAVVIEDTGADIPDMGHVNAGDMVRQRLEENDQLNWIFDNSKQQAIDSVRDGSAFAAFIIPSDFTSTLSGVLDGHAQSAHIDYYVNEKENAIAPKVTDTGATTLESQISSEFVRVVGEVASEKLKSASGEALDTARNGIDSTASTLRKAASQASELADGLADMDAAIAASRKAIADARSSLSSASTQASTLAGNLDHALERAKSMRGDARTLASDLSGALSDASGTLADLSSNAAYDIGAITGDIGWAQGTIDNAVAAVRSLDGTVQTFKISLESVRTSILELPAADGEQETIRNDIVSDLDTEISVLVTLTDGQKEQLDQLQSVSDAIKAEADAVRGLSASVNDAVQSGARSLSDLQSGLADDASGDTSSALNDFADAGSHLTGTLEAIGPATDQANALLAELDSLLAQTVTLADDTAETLRVAGEQIGSMADDIDALSSAQAFAELDKVAQLDPAHMGSYLSAPITMENHPVFPVENYGSGVAPFYTNLALWVGGFVLVAIFKLEVDPEGVGTFQPWQGFLGRWLLLAMLGQVQAIICCTGDIVLGIQCVSPVAYVAAGMVASLVYVLIVYALAISFKHIGKALGVLLVVLQIPGAAGTYPIEMMPGFFQALHPWLPFTYGIDAMREAVAGFYDGAYAANLGVLLLFCIPALVIGIGARRRLVSVNALFDRRLAETDLMIAEHVGADAALADPSRTARISSVLNDPARAERFERAYPVLVHRGIVALACEAVLLVVLQFVLADPLPLLICWIVALTATCTYLIVVEFLHARSQRALAAAPAQHLHIRAADPAAANASTESERS